MGPVKDADIFKAVKDNDRKKLLKLLSPEKGLPALTKLASREESNIPGGRIRIKLTHVNINCSEDNTGYTPLITAILKGNKDIVEDLILHSADVDTQDSKGNTPLHNAVFRGNIELVDLLLINKARVNLQNSDGNTSLHIACQVDGDHRVHILLKLLANGADMGLVNKDHQSALDIAAMFNKTDAVSVLLDHEYNTMTSRRSSVKPNSSAMIEASLRGHKDVVQLLLDYGYDPNTVDERKDTAALIEAVRFIRFPVVECLLKYGAKTTVQNSKGETPEILVDKSVPKPLVEKFKTLFDECKSSGATEVPKFLKELSRGMSLQGTKDYPILPNDTAWTQNTEEFCNSCTPNCPNTNLINDDLCSCWIASQATYAWTVLDLKYEHTLTALSIYGWDSPQMVRGVEFQYGSTIAGPWSTVVTCSCLRNGSTSIKDPGTPQTFVDFTARSRFWRLLVLDNHGGKCIAFHGIRLYGADMRIRTLLKENSLEHYTDDIIAHGFNTYKMFLLMKESELVDIVEEEQDRKAILHSLERDRPKEFHPAGLAWKEAPVVSVRQGEVIPSFSVKSSPGVKTRLQLSTEPGVQITGETTVWLESDSLTKPSVATFTGITIHTNGHHRLTVQCVDYPRVSLVSPQPIDIKSKTALREDVAMAFDDMEAMLKGLSESLDPVKE